MNDGSPVHNWLASNVGPLHDKLSRTPFYRRLLYYAENELGLVAMSLQHPEESSFFSRAVPVFAIPAHNASGKVELMSYADFHRGVDGDDAEATAFSDIVMPHKAGMKVVDDIVGGGGAQGPHEDRVRRRDPARDTHAPALPGVQVAPGRALPQVPRARIGRRASTPCLGTLKA